VKIYSYLQSVFDTQEVEILCSDCLDQVSDYVDLEITGQPAERLMPLFHEHIHQCPPCMEEYHLLRDLSSAEQNGEQASIQYLKNVLQNK
jgi:hypothetical protein